MKQSKKFDAWMQDFHFGVRLATLRSARDISARKMSLDLGFNQSYINHLENSKGFPKMESFMLICEYLDVTPEEFFRIEYLNPMESHPFVELFHKLTPEQGRLAYDLLNQLAAGNKPHR